MAQRIVLVTGASSGIGARCAAQLAAGGDRVYAASRRATAPEGCLGLAMDVDRDDSVQAAVDALLAAESCIDAVVLCAGWGLAGAVEDCSSEEAHAQFETNFFGAHRVCRAVIPAMRARGSGRIVLVSSLSARLPLPYQAFYSASKAALSNYAEALRFELAPLGIQVASIEPGNFRTGFTGSRRRARGWSDASAHAGRCAASIAWMERDEQAAPEPQAVVARIERLLRQRHPPIHSAVAAQAFERIGTALRALLPWRLYQAIALRVFRIL